MKTSAIPDITTIRAARIPQDLAIVRTLFQSYADGLGVDLGFQDFAAELLNLPGSYAVPRGRLLLAWQGTEALGCVALRPLDGDRCEMKRLFVQPAARGMGLGKRLAEAVCAEARLAGYGQICLDTLLTLTAAVRMYDSLGFKPIDPYIHNPLPAVIFLGRSL